MKHLTDDELLELALLRGEPDAPDAPHLRACAACAARLEAVRAEGDLLRRALPPVGGEARPPAAVPRRWNRAAVAAALLLGALAGALASRTAAPARPGGLSRSIDRVEDALRRIPEEVATLREAEPSRFEAEFPRVLTKAEALYGELLELTLGEPAPLTDGQRADIRTAVDVLYARIWTERNPVRLAEQFREALQGALAPEQFEALQARLSRDMESEWEEEIDIVSDDLAQALNLRHSEEERVRTALRSRYPRTELPLLSLAQWPPDQLAGDGGLAQAVREALPAEQRAAFDRYLEDLREDHRRVERVARGMAAGQGR
jgi:hypothetical protein